MERDSFIFYRSFYEAINEADTETQVNLYDAICRKALYDEDTLLDGTAKMLYTLIKPQLEANSKRYSDGQKGGRPKKETTGINNKKTTGFENKKPNKNVNVNDNDNENVNTVVGDSCVDGLQEVIDFYNNNIGFITPYGLEILQDYLKDMDYQVIIFAIKKAVEANVKTLQYIKGTLNNWNKAGIKTLIQAQEENEKFKNKPKETTKKAYQNYEQRDIKDFDNFYAN